MADTGNLFGTIRTLDGEDLPPLNCSLVQSELNNQCGWDESDCQCEWGLVSRQGWALVDDSSNWGLDGSTDWWDSMNTDATDLYFFGHGHDYKAALADYVKIGGSMAMTPRQALGVWFTRWYDYTQEEVEDIVFEFQSHSLPLDVVVLDMNWHKKNDWTGYTFDDRLYPYPEDLFNYLQSQGLLTAANLHDASGVGSFEKMYQPMCDALGMDCSVRTVS